MRIAIDDSVKTWTQTYFAMDSGSPLEVINHGTSEEYGIKVLNQDLQDVFQPLEVIHFDQVCTYTWIDKSTT